MKSCETERLRLFRHGFKMFSAGIVSGTPYARGQKILFRKITILGVINWWTLMSQIRYSPEIILWVVAWTVCGTKRVSASRGQLELERQRLERERQRGAESEQVE